MFLYFYFRCKTCSTVLNGEYLGKDGVPYCEKCYQKLFGVKCAYCNRYISGKVLQAGDNHHFHPTCARCTKCGDPFGDGEEMYLQGSAIWHPRCGPGPSETDGVILNENTNGHITDTETDRISNSAISELQVISFINFIRKNKLNQIKISITIYTANYNFFLSICMNN